MVNQCPFIHLKKNYQNMNEKIGRFGTHETMDVHIEMSILDHPLHRLDLFTSSRQGIFQFDQEEEIQSTDELKLKLPFQLFINIETVKMVSNFSIFVFFKERSSANWNFFSQTAPRVS
ncbi:hypothetical protein CRE_20502 [Caenorhabditis remanei]|uniref:Uncharacterized protein n=1 Tax=Caenorhabditis remanei TaxID=31234 RepID=E3N8A6_CAERE|nr:hypothetical protein CRE_20502 [Caenorhabditis remanei]